MKRRSLALVLAAMLLLSGCASMLETNFLDVQPHAGSTTTEDDPSVPRAETYSALVEGIYSFVSQGSSRGTIHIANYVPRDGSDLDQDLAAACDEIQNEDSLGAYSVDYIRYQTSYIVSYYEAELYISYRRTQGQVRGIRGVTGMSAVRDELESALTTFVPERVLRVSYFSRDEAYVRDLIEQLYYDNPLTAMGMPEVEVVIYPRREAGESGSNYARIIEVLFHYRTEQDTLRRQSRVAADRLRRVRTELEEFAGEEAAQAALELLQAETVYRPRDPTLPPENRDTVYAAMVEGEADSEGMALAYALYCRSVGVDCIVVSGTLDGLPHFWNIVTLPDGENRHVDTTVPFHSELAEEEPFLLHDADMVERGYIWDRTQYPACGNQPVLPSGEEPGETVTEPGEDGESGGESEGSAEGPGPSQLPEPSPAEGEGAEPEADAPPGEE